MSESSSLKERIRVIKRDGTIERFEISKMFNCIRNGLTASDETIGLDMTSAGGLAEAVFEYLGTTFWETPVSTHHLADLVEMVLSQTGHSAAGMAIRRHAVQREQLRKRLMVASARPADGRFVQQRWEKSLLVRHLRRRHHLDAPIARLIAGRVEQLLFNCGLRVATSGLIREMARSELLAWGLMSGALVVKRNRHSRCRDKVKENET